MRTNRRDNTFVLVYLLIGGYLWTGFRALCELDYSWRGQTAQGQVVHVSEYTSCGKHPTRMLGVVYEFVDSAGMRRFGDASFYKANAPSLFPGQTVAVEYIPDGNSCRLQGTSYGLEVAVFILLSAIGLCVWLCWSYMDRLLGGRPENAVAESMKLYRPGYDR